ncbi:hypothetical protein PU02_0718 [Bartonella ancashensis]|uniref:Uncharacterized protein n=1 Tax=Bartonella ancashensis TaxID=1318743 RepID=A0A0M4LGH1_9HYPH|nr:hypothetical protein PU02_0718 [Bartonella ancashensis]
MFLKLTFEKRREALRIIDLSYFGLYRSILGNFCVKERK